MVEQGIHYTRIHNAGIVGRHILGPLAEKVVDRAEKGKKISSSVISTTLHTARSRYAFESESGHFPLQRSALVIREIFEAVPFEGDAVDVVSTIMNVSKGEIRRDPLTAALQTIGSLIPFLPSDLLPATKAAWEDGVMRALLKRQDSRAVNILNAVEASNTRRLSSDNK
ncbi:MAG TPA: hypothetical protein VF189_05300 [Patescibacteria group bacterium]